MQGSEYIWQNGEFVRWDDAKVHVLTHTLHYGGGVFEGIRFYDTEHGVAIFKLADHVKRLFFSASVLNMKIKYDEKEIFFGYHYYREYNQLHM